MAPEDLFNDTLDLDEIRRLIGATRNEAPKSAPPASVAPKAAEPKAPIPEAADLTFEDIKAESPELEELRFDAPAFGAAELEPSEAGPLSEAPAVEPAAAAEPEFEAPGNQSREEASKTEVPNVVAPEHDAPRAETPAFVNPEPVPRARKGRKGGKKDASSAEKVACPSCGTPNSLRAQFCVSCGSRMSAPAAAPAVPAGKKACPLCDAPNSLTAQFCVVCGGKIATQEPAARGASAPAGAAVEAPVSEQPVKKPATPVVQDEFSEEAIIAEFSSNPPQSAQLNQPTGEVPVEKPEQTPAQQPVKPAAPSAPTAKQEQPVQPKRPARGPRKPANSLERDVSRALEEHQDDVEGKDSKGFEIYTLLHDLVVVLAALTIVFVFFFRLVGVSGASMCETLYDGDYLVLQSNFLYNDIEAGDVVVMNVEANVVKGPIVKRVIATEGQTVDIDFATGDVIVDGKVIMESYIKEPIARDFGTLSTEFPLTVPEGKVFVMGDNRNNSTDSRHRDIGCISTKRVLGKVLFLVFPGQETDKYGQVTGKRDFSRIGVVK